MKNSGVVDQDIDAAEGIHSPFDHLFNLSLLRHIGSNGYGRGTSLASRILDRFFAAAHQNNAGALADKSQSTRAANTAARAGDDCDLVFQSRVHRRH